MLSSDLQRVLGDSAVDDGRAATGWEAHSERLATSAPIWRASLLDWGLLCAPGLIWGASFLFIAEGLEALPPDGVTFARFIIGFLTLSMVPAARRPVQAADRARICWLGVLWLAFPMSMFPHAEQHVSSALTGMLNGAVPLMAAGVAAIVAWQVPSPQMVFGLVVGMAGVALMALPGIGAGGNDARSVLLIAFAIMSYGIAINLARPLQQRNGALPVVWRALAVALMLTAPLGVPALLEAHWSPRSWLALLALGSLGTAAANVIMALAAGKLGATRASATTFLIPVVALFLGMTIRDESVGTIAIAGGALCLLGAWLMRPQTPRQSGLGVTAAGAGE
jgi:drug/metabolite transporter (DMT)-like permease